MPGNEGVFEAKEPLFANAMVTEAIGKK